jgi:DNA repair protein RecN (Recombination protein N)
MLLQLNIRNYVIIESLTFQPEEHLNIITGETGAGKSIILGAMGLILGERAEANTLMNKEAKCVVEAHFDVKGNPAFREALAAEDLDEEATCIIRREIAANGKSRAFINDTPVTLHTLAKLTSLLVDLHQQFGHLSLKEDSFQMDVVDAMSGNHLLLKAYREQFGNYKKLCRQIEDHQATQLQFQKEADYKQFLFDELEQASFINNEIEEAETQLKQLAHAEHIIATLQSARRQLDDSEQPLINELKKIMQQLQGIANLLPAAEPLQLRINATYEELKDIAQELEDAESKISLDPEEMNRLQDRVDLGYKLLKKHGLRETNELTALHESLAKELQTTQNLAHVLERLEKEKSVLLKAILQQSQQLSANRSRHIPAFQDKLNALLKLVGMPNAQLAIELRPATEPGIHGTDTITFLLDANKSGTFTPVYKAASGGEMSRIMLSIKSLTAQAMQLPTLIFDEVDTGISGEAAKQVGILLKDLAQYHQVICITHQPQVAAKADTHFYVYKDAESNRVTAQLRRLNEEGHIYAIAQMIGGEKPSDAALKNAKELI